MDKLDRYIDSTGAEQNLPKGIIIEAMQEMPSLNSYQNRNSLISIIRNNPNLAEFANQILITSGTDNKHSKYEHYILDIFANGQLKDGSSALPEFIKTLSDVYGDANLPMPNAKKVFERVEPNKRIEYKKDEFDESKYFNSKRGRIELPREEIMLLRKALRSYPISDIHDSQSQANFMEFILNNPELELFSRSLNPNLNDYYANADCIIDALCRSIEIDRKSKPITTLIKTLNNFGSGKYNNSPEAKLLLERIEKNDEKQKEEKVKTAVAGLNEIDFVRMHSKNRELFAILKNHPFLHKLVPYIDQQGSDILRSSKLVSQLNTTAGIGKDITYLDLFVDQLKELYEGKFVQPQLKKLFDSVPDRKKAEYAKTPLSSKAFEKGLPLNDLRQIRDAFNSMNVTTPMLKGLCQRDPYLQLMVSRIPEDGTDITRNDLIIEAFNKQLNDGESYLIKLLREMKGLYPKEMRPKNVQALFDRVN